MIKEAIKKRKVTLISMLICVVVFLIANFAGQGPINWMILYPPYVRYGRWYTLLTYGFVHLTISHLGGNMYSFFFLGGGLEESLGSARYFIILIGSILGSGGLICLLNPNVATVGISGGLYGLMAAYVYALYKRGMLKDSLIRAGVLHIIVINIYTSFLPGVSLVGHLGGFITGLVLGLLLV